MRRRTRPALALRDAEGARHIDDAMLAQIHYASAVGTREALRRTGLLRGPPGPVLPARRPTQSSSRITGTTLLSAASATPLGRRFAGPATGVA
ncbi:hypothetical protein ACFVJH_23195 [Streptomyces decoyicus]|uniref:hypothetical protein n=1 Tax=Streptomyces decoyicus TaxID=249567 RepID=UPI00363D6968